MKKKLLYVDDEDANLFLFEMFFEDTDTYIITTANSGDKALKLLEANNESFDVLITDLTMPGMDGFELLEIVRKDYPLLKRYILTAHLENEKITSAIKSGLAINWFRKLADPDEMVEQITREV